MLLLTWVGSRTRVGLGVEVEAQVAARVHVEHDICAISVIQSM